jgi:hypothetical protein
VCELADAMSRNKRSVLQRVSLENVEMACAGVESIFKACAAIDITHLSLRHNLLAATELQAVHKVLSGHSMHPNLALLDLSNNKLGNSGARELASVVSLGHLSVRELRVSHCEISGAGYRALVTALAKLPTAVALVANGNQIEYEGLCSLAGVLKQSWCAFDKLELKDIQVSNVHCPGTEVKIVQQFCHLKRVLFQFVPRAQTGSVSPSYVVCA